MDSTNRKTMRLLDRVLIGILVLLAMLLAGLQAARAGEIVPSVGFARSTSDAGSVRPFGALALRGSILPMVKSEIAVAYRNERYNGGDLNVKMWPVTASLWLAPPMFYVGGGAGYYHTTFDYREGLGIADETHRQFGTHLGGGVGMPLVPGIASLDLHARYVHLRERDSLLSPGRVTQSFFTTQLGVAIKF
ncbi:MAG TPA: hypothetical protein VJY35_08055 [Candidatus Eisenbacteria bacterium]|nr:hypothetical protein [Candidatus Eisenbacteria bacterium]